MARRITLKTVLEEVKRLDIKLSFIEELIEEVIVRELPGHRLTDGEITQIKTDIKEMKKGRAVRLEEVARKYEQLQGATSPEAGEKLRGPRS